MAKQGAAGATHLSSGQVGIISTSGTGLQEVAFLLAGEGVGVSRAFCLAGTGGGAGESEMLVHLRACQADPDTEVIVLVAQRPPPSADDRILVQVRESEKPTVICFLGMDPRLVWQAGAIPAARLDEAAMRAAAWVRGWDQALISSRLEDEDEQWSDQAVELRARLGPDRRRLRGLFTSDMLCDEAQLMLSELSGKLGERVRLDRRLAPSEQVQRLREACADPGVAVVLLDVVLGSRNDPAGDLVSALPWGPGKPAIIGHVCGAAAAPQITRQQAARLRQAGMIVAHSNASAARLAGMVLASEETAN